jgi:hypothetical protein
MRTARMERAITVSAQSMAVSGGFGVPANPNTSLQDHLDVGGVFGFEDHLTLDLHRMADT